MTLSVRLTKLADITGVPSEDCERDTKWDPDYWLTPSELKALCEEVGCNYVPMDGIERRRRIPAEANAIKPSNKLPSHYFSSPAEAPPCDIPRGEVDAMFTRNQPDPISDMAEDCLIVAKAMGIDKAFAKRLAVARMRKRIDAMFDNEDDRNAFLSPSSPAHRPEFEW